MRSSSHRAHAGGIDGGQPTATRSLRSTHAVCVDHKSGRIAARDLASQKERHLLVNSFFNYCTLAGLSLVALASEDEASRQACECLSASSIQVVMLMRLLVPPI